MSKTIRTFARHLSTTCRFNNAPRPHFDPKKAFILTKSPSEWKLGAGASWKSGHEEQSRKTWVMKDTSGRDAYKLLTSVIVPRPIAFVSTLAEDGTPNLAPFSYFSMVSHNPPLLSISFTLPRNRPKDTRENILNTKEFTVNIVSEHFVEASNACSVEAPAPVDEWIVSGLTMEPSQSVKPPCVKESLVSMECQLHFHRDITALDSQDITNTLVLGLIKQAHVRESILLEDGLQVDPALLRPVARLGDISYSRLTEGFDVPRMSWKTVREDVSKLSEEKKS
ncbi:flavoprotein oxygenase [Moniliophthora roreri MCA 2997]|uniref:Flavoprotein oxygenase n=1 Tax=Moniliophthora roreri (strain MCA 2997) TaxID=1381753 RepID=V2XX99_MONRO|nr:flavoprotein oxygenase [Moniliophthora roreri MCA 2997]